MGKNEAVLHSQKKACSTDDNNVGNAASLLIG